MTQPLSDPMPQIVTAGVDGMLVRFADRLSEPANRAALAFRAAVESLGWDGVEETSSTLVSTFLRFDPLHLSHDDLRAQLATLLKSQDWYAADLPQGRRLWRIPAVFGTDMAPQLEQAAQAAGMTESEAIASLTRARVRVQSIGFAPGQPYLGELPEAWDISRQSTITPRVPAGAVAVAIRQFVVFSRPSPTGWLHVAQIAAQLFRPEADTPFLLRPGDDVQFIATEPGALEQMRRDPQGGATSEAIE